MMFFDKVPRLPIALFALLLVCLPTFTSAQESTRPLQVNSVCSQFSIKINTANCLLKIGDNYYWGLNSKKKDIIKARALYHQAFELGSAEAGWKLSDIYQFGIGVDVNRTRASLYNNQATRISSQKYFYKQARLYEKNGEFEKAISILEIASRNGNRLAQRDLAGHYLLGIGVKKDFAEAYKYIFLGHGGKEQKSYVHGHKTVFGKIQDVLYIQEYEDNLEDKLKNALNRAHAYAAIHNLDIKNVNEMYDIKSRKFNNVRSGGMFWQHIVLVFILLLAILGWRRYTSK